MPRLRLVALAVLGLSLAVPASASAIVNSINFNAGNIQYQGPTDGAKALTATVVAGNLRVRETGMAGLNNTAPTATCTFDVPSKTFSCPVSAVTGSLTFSSANESDSLTVDPSVTNRVTASMGLGNDTVTTG